MAAARTTREIQYSTNTGYCTYKGSTSGQRFHSLPSSCFKQHIPKFHRSLIQSANSTMGIKSHVETFVCYKIFTILLLLLLFLVTTECVESHGKSSDIAAKQNISASNESWNETISSSNGVIEIKDIHTSKCELHEVFENCALVPTNKASQNSSEVANTISPQNFATENRELQIRSPISETESRSSMPGTKNHYDDIAEDTMHFGLFHLPACDSVNSSCGSPCQSPHWSCSNRCQHNNHDPHEPCSCHVTCLLYKTCCQDFVSECPEEFRNAKRIVDTSGGMQAKCDGVSRSMVISNCPSSINDVAFRDLCENPDNIIDKVFPVTDSTGTYHFKSLACFLCWDKTISYLGWRTKATFPPEIKYMKEYNLASVVEFVLNYPQYSQWFPPKDTPMHRCQPDVVSQCTGCYNADLASKCSQFVSLVKIGHTTYRNKYCYLCSSEYVSSIRKTSLIETDEPNSIKTETPQRQNPLEFNVMIEFVGDTLRGISSEPVAGPFSWKELHCSISNLYDCTTSQCYHSEIMPNGRCEHTDFRSYHLITFCLMDEFDFYSCVPNKDNVNSTKRLVADIFYQFHDCLERELTINFDHESKRQIFYHIFPNDTAIGVVFQRPVTVASDEYTIMSQLVWATTAVLKSVGVKDVEQFCIASQFPSAMAVLEKQCFPYNILLTPYETNTSVSIVWYKLMILHGFGYILILLLSPITQSSQLRVRRWKME